MKNFIRLRNYDLPVSARGGRFIPSELDMSLGQIPGWVNFIDPSEFNPASGVLNRVRKNDLLFSQSITIDEFDNGLPAFSGDGYVPTPNPVPTVRFSTRQNNLITPENWTVFGVVKLHTLTVGVGNEQITWLMRSRNSTTLENSINIALHQATDNIIWYKTGVAPPNQPIRHSVGGNFLDRPTPTLIMCTFSPGRGYGVFRNGIEVGRFADTNIPNTPSSSGYSQLTNLNGLAGVVGFINRDLSDKDHSRYRRSMVQYLIDHYEIDD